VSFSQLLPLPTSSISQIAMSRSRFSANRGGCFDQLAPYQYYSMDFLLATFHAGGQYWTWYHHSIDIPLNDPELQ
jgi:hypothetical protein